MDELRGGEWQEVSRWIKFEEDLLEGAERWGRPHISSLTFHSVINLRLVLEQCKCLSESFLCWTLVSVPSLLTCLQFIVCSCSWIL
jgi:hypothetical protein